MPQRSLSVFTPWRVERAAYVWIFDARDNVILKWSEDEKPDALWVAEHIVECVNANAGICSCGRTMNLKALCNVCDNND